MFMFKRKTPDVVTFDRRSFERFIGQLNNVGMRNDLGSLLSLECEGPKPNGYNVLKAKWTRECPCRSREGN